MADLEGGSAYRELLAEGVDPNMPDHYQMVLE